MLARGCAAVSLLIVLGCEVQLQDVKPEFRPPPLDPRLLEPASANEAAPGRFTARLNTTEGPVHIEVVRAWAPRGADRFYNMVNAGLLSDVAFFRVVEGFMAQTGIHGNPRISAAWRDARIRDDAVSRSNARGMVSFATSGPHRRTTQFFINLGDNGNLDTMGFAPFGRVRGADIAVVDRIHAGYGDAPPGGSGPSQGDIQSRGNRFLRDEFPALDYIESAEIL